MKFSNNSICIHVQAALAQVGNDIYPVDMPPLSVAQAHEVSGVPRRTITYAITQGQLKAARLGDGAWMIEAGDLDEWISSRNS